MPSMIDPTHPAAGIAVSKAASRANWAAAKAEIEALQVAAGNTINVKARFGAVTLADQPNQATAANDNNDALIRLRNFMRTDRTKHYHVVFPPGQYVYTDNRWLLHVGAPVTIQAVGARFQNIAATGSHISSRPLNTHSIFFQMNDDPADGVTLFHTGHLINTAQVGARTVTTTTAAEAANFSAGMPVLLHGFDQQMQSFPPNMRYFQWNEVVSVNAGTGVVTLRDPLRFELRSDWRDEDREAAVGDTGLIYGKARIVSLRRGTDFYYNPYVEIIGAEWLENPNADTNPGANALTIAADTLILRGVTFHGQQVSPTETRYTLYDRCTTAGGLEGDKICDAIVLKDCQVGGQLGQFTGVNQLVVEDSTVRGALAAEARECIYRRNRILMPASDTLAPIRSPGYPTSLLLAEDNEIVHTGDQQAYMIDTGGGSVGLTPSAIGAGGEILLTHTTQNHLDHIQNIAPGTFLHKSDLSNYGRITSITWNGTQYVIAGNWLATPTTSETYFWHKLHRVEERRNIARGPTPMRSLRQNNLTQLIPTGFGHPRGPLVFTDGFNWNAGQAETVIVNARITRIRARVLKPYTGSTHVTPMLLIELGPNFYTPIELILDKVGYLEASTSGTFEEATNDMGTARSLGAPNDVARPWVTFSYKDFGTGGNPFLSSVTDAEAPRLWIEVEAEPVG